MSVGRNDAGATDPAVGDLPHALERRAEIRKRLDGSTVAVFLDYDGTLTPIVDRPEEAILSDETRRTLERLAVRCPVAVISGRDLPDVRRLVGVDGVFYAGSHGFDIAGPGGVVEQRGVEFVPDIDRAEEALLPLLDRVPGARLERKRFGIAVHVRRVEDRRVAEVERIVDRVALEHPRLRKTGGKKVFELRPNVEWHKGSALLRLMRVLGLGDGVMPVYMGDDVTDEDAFRAIRHRGLGIVVRGEDDARPTAAHYMLVDIDEVRTFLSELARLGTSVGGPGDAGSGPATGASA